MTPPSHRSIPAAAAAAAVNVVDLTYSSDTEDEDNVYHSTKPRGGPRTTTPNKKKKASTPEKRAGRYRSSCPQSLRERFVRALQQRMYLVDKEQVELPQESVARKRPKHDHPENTKDNNAKDNDGTPTLDSYWKFTILGSTGNVYTVNLTHKPCCDCPDFCKRQDVCKHLIFVLCRVIGLDPHDPMAYQKAYLTSELLDFSQRIRQRTSGSNVWANEQVRSTYASAMGKSGPRKEVDETNDSLVRRRPLDECDCPICLESMTSCPGSQVTFCKVACGMNFHLECMRQWRRAQGNKTVTCPNCRAREAPTKPDPGEQEGYVNFGRLQGQSPERDTSTYRDYYSDRRRRRRRRW